MILENVFITCLKLTLNLRNGVKTNKLVTYLIKSFDANAKDMMQCLIRQLNDYKIKICITSYSHLYYILEEKTSKFILVDDLYKYILLLILSLYFVFIFLLSMSSLFIYFLDKICTCKLYNSM
jgi:hypothetical protein